MQLMHKHMHTNAFIKFTHFVDLCSICCVVCCCFCLLCVLPFSGVCVCMLTRSLFAVFQVAVHTSVQHRLHASLVAHVYYRIHADGHWVRWMMIFMVINNHTSCYYTGFDLQLIWANICLKNDCKMLRFEDFFVQAIMPVVY